MPVDRSCLPAPGPARLSRSRRSANRRCPTACASGRSSTAPSRCVALLLVRGWHAAIPSDRGRASRRSPATCWTRAAAIARALGLHEALAASARSSTPRSGRRPLLGLTVLSRFSGARLLAARRYALRVRASSSATSIASASSGCNRLIQLRDLPPALADRAFTELLYGSHPYGHLAIGTEGSLRADDRDDVPQFPPPGTCRPERR